jgi:hypothetical protein
LPITLLSAAAYGWIHLTYSGSRTSAPQRYARDDLGTFVQPFSKSPFTFLKTYYLRTPPRFDRLVPLRTISSRNRTSHLLAMLLRATLSLRIFDRAVPQRVMYPKPTYLWLISIVCRCHLKAWSSFNHTVPLRALYSRFTHLRRTCGYCRHDFKNPD